MIEEEDTPEVGQWVLDWIHSRGLTDRIVGITYRTNYNLQYRDGELSQNDDAWHNTEIEVRFKV